MLDRETFVPLSALLVLPRDESLQAVSREPLAPEPPAPAEFDDTGVRVRRFHAALDDALELALEDLLSDIAASVIARELEIAPCELRAIVDRARARYRDERALRVRVHPDEMAAFENYDVAVEADATLRRGDAAIELHAGTIDARLGIRLEALLQQ